MEIMAPKKALATHQPRATQIDKLELVLDQSIRLQPLSQRLASSERARSGLRKAHLLF
jgi:hypothetical protein